MIIFWGVGVNFTFQDFDNMDIGSSVQPLYSHYIDMALIVILGFGLMLSFLKKYSHSSMGGTFLFAAAMIQWAILNYGFWVNVDSTFLKIHLNIEALIYGIFGVLSVVITFGVLGGKLTLLAMFLIGIVEIFLWGLNFYIGSIIVEADDPGLAIYTHVFGAFYGLGATLLISFRWNRRLKEKKEEENKEIKEKEKEKDKDNKEMIDKLHYSKFDREDTESDYSSDFLSIIGTILMWILWPSINSALAKPGAQYRVVINTFVSQCSSVVFAFWVSKSFKKRKFGMREIQTASIAGGIAMSSSVSETIVPGAAMLVGAITSSAVTIAIMYLKPWLDSPNRLLPIHDTRGAIQLHGFGGFISVVAGIVATAIAHHNQNIFGQSYDQLFRQGHSQPGLQTAALFISMGIGLVGGAICGIFFLFVPSNYVFFSDEHEFALPHDFEYTRTKKHQHPEIKEKNISEQLDKDIEAEK